MLVSSKMYYSKSRKNKKAPEINLRLQIIYNVENWASES